MEYVPVFALMFIFIGLISWSWVKGIDHMKENHPDYEADDLFGKFDNDNHDEDYPR